MRFFLFFVYFVPVTILDACAATITGGCMPGLRVRGAMRTRLATAGRLGSRHRQIFDAAAPGHSMQILS